MSGGPKENSQTLLESLKAHYRQSSWFGRTWERWFERQSQTEKTLVKVLAALREELAEQMDARLEFEQRMAAQLQEERARREAASEAATEEGQQLRLVISALQAAARAAHEGVEREAARRMAEREEDRAHLARFSHLSQETLGNLHAAERLIRALDVRLQGMDSAAAAARAQAAQNLAQGLARASEQLIDLEQRLQDQARVVEEAVAAERAESAKTAARVDADLKRMVAAMEQIERRSLDRSRTTEAAIAAGRTESADAVARMAADLRKVLAATEKEVRNLQDRQAANLDGLAKTGVAMEQLRASLDRTATALSSRIADVHRGLPYFESAEAAARFDDFYFAFERRYRGSRAEIARRQRVYLPFLQESEELAKLPKDKLPIVDLGCGRGEWLELLRSEGYGTAVGVDQSDRMIQICKTEDLTIINDEALHYLRGLPEASVGVVSAFHVVEHLAFSDLLELLTETRRVLVPGGLLLLETPNVENTLVATVNFRHDPTHRFMIPPLLLTFAVEHTGFATPTPLRLHPYGPEYQVEMTSSVGRRFNDFFFSAQDFGLVAAKP